MNFNLPQEVLVFVARIISLHLPQDRLKLPLCTSMYLLSRHFELGQSKSRRVHYCNACHEKLPHFYAQHGEVFPCQCAAARAHTAKTEYMILLDVAEEMRHRLSGTWREWADEFLPLEYLNVCLSFSRITLDGSVLVGCSTWTMWLADPGYQALLVQDRHSAARPAGVLSDVYDGAGYQFVVWMPRSACFICRKYVKLSCLAEKNMRRPHSCAISHRRLLEDGAALSTPNSHSFGIWAGAINLSCWCPIWGFLTGFQPRSHLCLTVEPWSCRWCCSGQKLGHLRLARGVGAQRGMRACIRVC